MDRENIEEILNKLGTEDVPPEARQIAREMSEDFSKTLKQPKRHIFLEYIMKSKITKLAAAAAIIFAVALSITVVNKLTSEAYAIVQTVEALKDVRFLHLISYDANGQVQDERWIEIGMDGRQIRYRQDTPPDFLVVEDGNSTAAYHKDKHAVVLYDRKYKQYVWVGDLGEFFENLRQKGTIIEQNTNYRGRAAHKILWPMANAEVYVDPVTKLPFAIGNTELSYEQPPPGTFEIIIPEGCSLRQKTGRRAD